MTTQDTAASADAGIDHLGLIAEMSRDFADSLDIDTTIQRGLERIAGTLDAEGASIFLLESADRELVCRACHGPVDIAGLRLPAGTGIVGRAVATGHAQIVRDAHSDPDFGAVVDAHTGLTTRSVICAPLRVRDQTLGAIELINKRGGCAFNPRDAQLLTALSASAALAIINARLAASMVEREGMRRELELAAAMQRSFLPEGRPADFPVHGLNRPARHISGDFYDIVARPDGRIWFTIGDVSGKGSNAALLMAKTASLFRYLARTAADPAEVLRAINRELYETAVHGMFVTMTCGDCDAQGRWVRLANAGHPPALEVPAGGGTLDSVNSRVPAQAPPLGILSSLEEAGSGPQAVALDLADRHLYLFTDGLTEARRARGGATTAAAPDELGEAGLITCILGAERAKLAAPARLRHILDAVAPEGRAPADDLTVLVIEGPGS